MILKGLTREQVLIKRKDEITLKRCKCCNKEISVNKFGYKKSPVNQLYYSVNTCENCLYERRKTKHGHMFTEYNKKLKERLIYTIEGRASLLLSRCKNNARKYNFDFNLTKKQLEDKLNLGFCERTKIPFHLGELDFHPYAPSIDRIDCNKGYVENNIQMVCMIYNLAKNKFGDDAVTDFIADTIKYSNI